jgi:hypothetical protein
MKPLLAALIDRNIDISKIISDPGLKSSDIVSMDFQDWKMRILTHHGMSTGPEVTRQW